MSEGKLYSCTVSMTVNFLAPAKPGPIVAEGKVTQLGKTIAFVEGKLLAQDGTLLATASSCQRLLDAARRFGLNLAWILEEELECPPCVSSSDVGLGSKRDIGGLLFEVCFTSKNGHPEAVPSCPLGHETDLRDQADDVRFQV